MPLFMDVHIIPGVKARDVAAAHEMDLLHQESFGCKCMTYWIDEVRNSVFCLIEAPGKKDVEALHKSSHGLIPLKIIEVQPELVHAFLGRIFDPEDVQIAKGLKVFQDPSFRIIVVSEINDPVLLRYELGEEAACHLLEDFQKEVNAIITSEEGRWVSQEHERCIFCFPSELSAFNFSRKMLSLALQNKFKPLRIRIAVSGCEPVQKSAELFGDGIRQGSQFCFASRYDRVLLSPLLKPHIPTDLIRECQSHYFLTWSEETFLNLVLSSVESRALESDFNITTLSEQAAMSQSQLYRNLIRISGKSPHCLLIKYRLRRSKEMLKIGGKQVSETAYTSGFSSPSYFSKCFREEFGILPAEYARIAK